MVRVVSLSDLDLSTQALTAGAMSWHSEFIRGWQAVKPPSPIGSSTSMTLFPTLHLNAFRGVRAISEFDWPFTPTHRSSEDFSTSNGSVLHSDTIRTSTCPWVDHTVSRLAPVARALFRLAFAPPTSLKDLNLLLRTNSQDHYAKGTLSPLKAPTACRHTVSGSFHSPSWSSFHLSLTVLVHYRSLGSIQPWRMVSPSSDRISRVPPYLIPLCRFRIQDFHFLRCDFPDTFANSIVLGYSVFARHYSRNLFDFSSYGYLDVSVPHVCVIAISSKQQVALFGHLRIKVCLQLPVAFRSLPRPSQPPRAQASPVCPY